LTVVEGQKIDTVYTGKCVIFTFAKAEVRHLLSQKVKY
jgi:hypothetical protein